MYLAIYHTRSGRCGCVCYNTVCACIQSPINLGLRQGGLVVNACASHAVDRGFASRPSHIKDHHKNGTNCLTFLARLR